LADLVEEKSRETVDKSDAINAQTLFRKRQRDAFASICHYFSTGRYFCDHKLREEKKKK
jgi:hypothetical protein